MEGVRGDVIRGVMEGQIGPNDLRLKISIWIWSHDDCVGDLMSGCVMHVCKTSGPHKVQHETQGRLVVVRGSRADGYETDEGGERLEKEHKKVGEDKELPEKRCRIIQCKTYEVTNNSLSCSIVFTPGQIHASSS